MGSRRRSAAEAAEHPIQGFAKNGAPRPFCRDAVRTIRSMRLTRLVLAIVLVSGALAACSSASSDTAASPTTRASSTTSTSSPSTTRPATTAPCGNTGKAPSRYKSVVVFAFENRTWNDVGLGFGPEMPYLRELGRQCAYFRTWTETDTAQSSLTQYVGAITGARQPSTQNDCSPSPQCSTDADSIFRQLRTSNRRAVSFVEGATEPCSATNNAPRHVPPLYLWAPQDRAHCRQQVRPLTDFDVEHLPAFSFITPNLCNDGHDCGNAMVDGWAQAHIQPVLDGAAYRHGKVAVFVWYDEDQPVPNLWVTPTAKRGPLDFAGAGAMGTLRAWQDMLGLPCLAQACSAPDMRAPANS
jgi:phosphatidylinositol-3-phosphatase